MYSRLSAFYDDFLRPTICEYSVSPPSYMECDGDNDDDDSGGAGVIVPSPTTPSPVWTDVIVPSPTTPSPVWTDVIVPNTPSPVTEPMIYPTTPSPVSTDSMYDGNLPTPPPVMTDSTFYESWGIPTPPPVVMHSPNDGPLTFAPVTGSITCARPGMACTIKCANCATLKRVALGMSVASPDEYTITYTAEHGTDDHPDDPSRLIVVATDGRSTDEITCDGGCTCSSVNDRILGCGLVAESISESYPSTTPFVPNCSVCIGVSRYLVPCALVLVLILRYLSF